MIYPMTRGPDEIPIGFLRLKDLLNEYDVEADERTVPSKENIERIRRGEEPYKIRYPHEIIIWHKRIAEDNIRELESSEDVDVHESAVIEGDVVLGDNVKIGPFAYIKGPAFIGKGSVIKEHASIKESHIGKRCKIGGEVENSIILDYSNKQHHGYIGHSLIGGWVNIGAGTTCSDLKNTYGTIKVDDGEGHKIDTGEQFLGCIIGDFSKTSINTTIFTGKIIGINSHVSGTVDKDIPSMMFGDKRFSLEKAFDIQRRMFKRRGVEQTGKHKDILRKANRK